MPKKKAPGIAPHIVGSGSTESQMHTNLTPTKMFLTKGKGVANEKLTSFEMALRDAGIAHLNLVRVSSIFPPGCQIITRPKGAKLLRPGQVCFVVMSENETNEPNRLMAASVGLAVPKAGDHWGYLSEHHSFGETARKAGEYAEDLAATMLATTLGVDFNPDKNYDERKEIYRMSGKVVTSREITQSAEGDKNGLWTTVISAAVLLFD